MDSEEVKQWGDRIDRIADQVAADFPDALADDLAQSMWEGLLREQAKGKMLDWNALNMVSALRFMARTAAWEERKNHLSLSSQYNYRTTDVRHLLETFFERSEWEGACVAQDAVSELNFDGVEMSADLSRAWDLLTRPQKTHILLYFGFRQKVDSKKLSAAIKRMADILNDYQPIKNHVGVGNRRIVSNATGMATIRGETD